MCNAKPGRRCAGPDTQKPIVAAAQKLNELKRAYDAETDPEKRTVLRKKVIAQNEKFRESKVTYYASAKAQKDFTVAVQTVKELTGDRRATYDDVEETLFLAGGQLHELQAKADKMRKDGASQIEVARYFNQGGILIETEKMRDRIEADNGDTTPTDDDSFDARTRQLKALQIAKSVMWKDCAAVVNADMKKNSKEYLSTGSDSRLTISKRPTGQFAVTNEFILTASSPAEAEAKALKAYEGSGVQVDVQLVPVKGRPNEYLTEANYIYKGGESIVNALIFQNKIYKGHKYV